MFLSILYSLAFIFLFLIPWAIIIYLFYNFYCDLKGAPFVPTSSKKVDEILNLANLKPGQYFIELGSGDGRVVRTAVKKYGVKGLGVDLNPYLIFTSILFAKIQKLRNLKFKRQNFILTDIKKADIIFLFLFPKALNKLKPKFINECKKETLIISHGFQIKGFEKLLYKTFTDSPFSTYFYKIS